MKRTLRAPVIGLGLGAAALGGATYVGGSTRCAEGRVVDTLAQCQSIVGFSNHGVCSAAFSGVPTAQSRTGVADRAVFLKTQPNGAPTTEAVTRLAGDQKWRALGGGIIEPYRNGCSGSRSSSGASSSRWSNWGSSSTASNAASSAATARGGFGSSAVSFFSGS